MKFGAPENVIATISWPFAKPPKKGLKVLQAYCGQGIYGELQNGQPKMFDITEHLQSLVRDDHLNCSMGEATKTIQQSVSPKWFLSSMETFISS